MVQAVQDGSHMLMRKSTQVAVSAVAGPLVGKLAEAAVNQLPNDAKLAAGGGALLGAATGLKVAVAAKLMVIEARHSSRSPHPAWASSPSASPPSSSALPTT